MHSKQILSNKVLHFEFSNKIEEFALIHDAFFWIGELRCGELVTTEPDHRTCRNRFF